MIIEVNIGGQMLMQKEPKWKRCLINLFPIVEWGDTIFNVTKLDWIHMPLCIFPCRVWFALSLRASLVESPLNSSSKVFGLCRNRASGFFFFFFVYHFCIRKQVGRVDYEEIMDSIHDRLFYLLLENVFQLKCLRVFVFNMVNI